jgi:ELWxxDGT repeat protein
MPLTWLRRSRRRPHTSRPSTLTRRPALAVESLEDRALMSATMIQEITPQIPFANPGSLTNVNGTLYFTINDGAKGTELWKSDGTSAGTVLLHDFTSTTPPGSTWLSNLTNVNGTLFFEANNTQLWKSDGTATGTTEVGSFSFLTSLTSFNNTLYFSGGTSAGGVGLWKSDGTATGTVDVQRVNISSPLVAMNGSLYFAGADQTGLHGDEVWKSNGTAAGTSMLVDINPGTGSSFPMDLFAVGNKLFFDVLSPAAQSGLWVSDGSSSGTVHLQQVNPYSAAGSDMVGLNGDLYFLNAGPSNAGLWKSDGTPTGTTLVSPISNNDDATVSMTAFQGDLFYLRNTNGQSQLWKTDGTATGTTEVKLPANAEGATSLMNVNGALFFTAWDARGGFELWKSDGTSAGTTLVEDIGNVVRAQLANVNGVLDFAIGDGHGIQLWKYDPSSGPTATANGPYTLYVGGTLSLNGLGSTGTTPTPNLTYSWSVNGHVVPGTAANPQLTWAQLATYGITGPGTYAISLTVTEGTATSTSVTDVVVRSPLLNLTGVPETANEGESFNGIVARFTDPAGFQTTSIYNAQVDWGDGSAPTTAQVQRTWLGLAVLGSHVYAEEGTYTVKINLEKGDGLANSVTSTIKVNDAGFWAGRQYVRATEGTSWTGTVATVTDGNAQGKAGDFTATIQWGDGTTTTGTVTMTSPGHFAVQGSHAFTATGRFNVSVKITDVGGSTSTAQTIFDVGDAALHAVPAATFGPLLPMRGTALVSAFADANPLSTASQFTATIDWGDGTTSAGTVAHAVNQPFFVVTGNHTYAKNGTYRVATQIRDAGGNGLYTSFALATIIVDPPPPVLGQGPGNNH